MHAITLENLNYYLNYFNKLKKANLEFEINKTEKYVAGEGSQSAYYQIGFYATFKNVTSLRALADIWTAAPNTIQLDAIQGFKGLDAMTKDANCTKVNGDLYRKNVPGVKFYAASVFDNNNRVNLYLLEKAVPEKSDGNGHTIRSCIHGGVYSGGQLVFCADEQTPFYNYVDQGHVICYVSTGDSIEDGHRMFITDAVTLDMNYVIAAASVYPPAIDEIIQHKAFIPSKDCRLQLLKMEKAMPAKLRDQYIQLKTRIQEDFSKNTSNVMIGKLKRAESPFIDLNGIRITSTRADYTAGHVSIEAKNLAEVVFSKLNPNEAEWDIFTLINIYTDWVNDQFKGLTLNADETGFAEAKNFSFKINDIPLKISCSTENTRRSINGHLINVDELSPVLRRASCYQQVEGDPVGSNIENFDKFISNVSRHSLKIRDVWANGLPVKTVFFETDRNSYGKPATLKHPKLRFVHKDAKNAKGFYLVVNIYDPKDKTKVLATHEYKIGKFAEFVKKVDQVNRQAYMGYQGDYTQTKEGFFVPKNNNSSGNTCGTKLAEMLTTYADGITEEDKKNIVGVINYELSEAEKRSEELLKEACDLTGAKASTRDGKQGYVVKGKMRSYFVETEGVNKVWEHHDDKNGSYVCIVNRGEMGVGRDALVARLFALANDEMMAKQIHTLKR
jgi:hypothetical protein